MRQLAFLLKLQQFGGASGFDPQKPGDWPSRHEPCRNSLGQKHLIIRMRSAKDRRFCNVNITDQGSALVRQLCEGA